MKSSHQLLLAGTLLFITACSSKTPAQPGASTGTDSSSAAASESVVGQSSSSSSSLAAAVQAMEKSSTGTAMEKKEPPKAQVRVVTVTADTWSFTPKEIRVKKGEKVTLKLMGKAGVHGFMAPELGLNPTIEPGQTVQVNLPTDNAGTFNFFCSV